MHDRSNMRGRGRASAALGAVLSLLVTLVAVVVAAPPAVAAIDVPFASRFTANTTGDILIRGNGLLSCPSSAATCAAARAGTATGAAANNNGYQMSFVDVDSDPNTRSSSSAVVEVPSTEGVVLWAGLYWSAYSTAGAGAPSAPPPAGTARTRLLLQAPGDVGYRTITASRVQVGSGSASGSYQSFAEVTDLVNSARGGVYTAADIFAGTGQDRYGAWSLVVAYGSPSLPVRNLTVFDGFGTVQANPATERSLDIPVSGFLTPPSGTVRTRLGTVVYEGDRGSSGDTLSVIRQDGTLVQVGEPPSNPLTNSFNSTITDNGVSVPGRFPSYDNQLGYDADVFDASYLGNNATSATLRLATPGNGETFFPGVVTFVTDLYTPELVSTKTATTTDVDGNGTIGAGDRITYGIRVENVGDDVAIAAEATDAIPIGTEYVAGSLTVDGTSVTDAADADRADVVAGQVRATLGVGVGAAAGRVPIGGVTTLEFTVEVTEDNLDGAEILDASNHNYRGDQTGIVLTGTSNTTTTPYTGPRADLAVTKEALPALVQRDGTREVTYRLVVTNNGPSAEPTASVTDPLPAGFTVTSVTGPGCDPDGPTLACTIGALAVGASAVVTVAGTLPAGAADPTPNTATVGRSVGSVDPLPTNDAATAQVAVNSPPVATDDRATVAPGGSATISVLDDDTDPDGDPLTVTTAVVTPPTNGTVVLNADGTLTYAVTDPAFKGTDNVTYEVCDDRGGCDTATVTVTVPNAPPVATDDTTGTTPGVPVTVDVLFNDADPNGDLLTVTAVSQPPATSGSVAIVGGLPQFTPAPGFAGDATFTYTVCDDDAPPGCDSATVTVTVSNAAPVAVDDSTTTTFETPLTIPGADLLGNDTDPNGDTLGIASVQDPQGGTVVLNADGTVTFTPADGFIGTASFTYTISDGNGGTSTATVLVEVPNTPPTAQDDAATVSAAGSVEVDVLGNDDDTETPDDLTVTLTEVPTSGSAAVSADGTVTYTAEPSFKGEVTIPYSVCDPSGLCDEAVITVTVANAPPLAVDESRTTGVNSPVTVPVLANDSDPNGDTVTLTSVTQPPPGQGTVTIVSGELVYTPPPDFFGTVAITYQVCDDDTSALCDTATLTVDVVNQPPVAGPDSGTTGQRAGQPSVIALDVLGNDTDPDAQPLTVVEVTQPGTGAVVINPDGTLTYTAPPGFVGTETFTYKVVDGSGAESTTTVTVAVTDESPVAVDDTATTATGTPVTLDLTGNDADPDRDALRVTAIPVGPANGTVTLGADGSVVYAPNPGFTGTDTFTYLVCDPYGLCDEAVVTVTVTAPPPTPPTGSLSPAPAPAFAPAPRGGTLPVTGSSAPGLVPLAVTSLLLGVGLLLGSRRALRRVR